MLLRACTRWKHPTTVRTFEHDSMFLRKAYSIPIGRLIFLLICNVGCGESVTTYPVSGAASCTKVHCCESRVFFLFKIDHARPSGHQWTHAYVRFARGRRHRAGVLRRRCASDKPAIQSIWTVHVHAPRSPTHTRTQIDTPRTERACRHINI